MARGGQFRLRAGHSHCCGLEETGRWQSRHRRTALMLGAGVQLEAPCTGGACGQVSVPSKAMSLLSCLPEATLGLGSPKEARPPLLPN